MPLLRRQPFVKAKPPPDLKPDEEVFHCKLTNEIFRDYDEFFERIILCNSLVWTCAVTGRPQLTYQEALESEAKARKHLSMFPKVYQRPILCLASMTYRTRLSDLNDDVFVFAKDRYFVGEEVEVFHRNSRKMGTILSVIPPKEKPRVPKKPPTPKRPPPPPEDSDSDVKIIEKPVMIDLTLSDSELDDRSKDQAKSPVQSPTCSSPKGTPMSAKSSPRATPSPTKLVRNKTIDPEKYSYVVKLLGEKKDPITVKSTHVSRKKGVLTRDKCKLFLKQHCEAGDGIWRVKPKFIGSLSIDDDTWDDVFAGPRPAFVRTEVKKKAGKSPGSAEKFFRSKKEEKKRKEREKMEKEAKKKLDEEAKAAKRIKKLEKEQARKKLTPEEKAALAEKIKQEKLELKMKQKEEKMKKNEEEKAKRKEEREKEREKQKEERRIQAEFYKEWSKIRDDMECDDLKPLPEPTPVGTQIPPEVFGDVLMLLEFNHHFKILFDMTDTFQTGINLELIEKALLDTETNGPWFDLLKLLLTTIFCLVEEEEEEELELEKENHGVIPGDLPEGIDDDMSDISTQYLIQTATAAAQWPMLYQGTPLSKLSLDAFTITELLRLHFLSSGARASVLNSKFRYQQRGGYTSLDDAGLEFRREQPAIIKALGNGNVFDLGPRDKMKIVHALLGQMLTYAVARDIVEESYEQAKQLRMDLRSLQASEQKREREEATARWKRRMEERAKEKEREAERKAQKQKEKEEQLLAAEKTKEEGAVAKPEKSAAAVNLDDVRTSGRLKLKKIDKEEKAIEVLLEDYEKLKDLDYSNLSDHQKRIVDGKRAEFSAKRKEEVRQQEQEILDQIYEAQSSFAVYPIGRDRLYRRYWMFKSLPGLFVEDDEGYISKDCLEPVPQKRDVTIPGTGSDKENDSFEGKLPNGPQEGKSVLGSESDINRTHLVNGGDTEKMDVDGVNVAMDQIVNRKNMRWAFYNTGSDLDQLLNSLNQRGARESALRQALLEQKDRIIQSMQQCPAKAISCRESHQFETSNPKEMQRTFMNIKSRNRQTQGSVKNNTAQEFIELNLREALLDLEERIYHGSLGALKVKGRLSWRDAIEQGGYDRQDSGQVNGGDDAVKMEIDDRASVASSDYEDSVVVKDMSHALLQLARGVESKYLKQPLGEEESKKKKGKTRAASKNVKKEEEDKDDASEDGKPAKTPMERWEESLVTCTSLSQIFVHMSTLESSIIWSKSALHAQCRICRRRGDGDKMLLCDMCDRGHHMFCLKPPVKSIPSGDWYCPNCRPKNVARSPRKARRKFVESESEGEEDSSDEEEGSDEEDDSDEEEADSSEEEADSEDEGDDDDDEEQERSDDDEEEEEEEDEDSEEEEEDRPPAPAKIKLRGKFNKPESRRSSGKGTPTASASSSRKGTPTMEGRNSKKSTPNDRRSGSRLSKGGGSQPNSASKSSKRKSQEMNGSVDDGPAKKSRRSSLDTDAKPRAKSSFRSNETFQQINQCEEIVGDLMKHEDAWPFLKPVSKRDAPDYFDIIKKPMDFSTIRVKMNKFVYTEASQIVEDIRLVFINCEKYNPPGATEYKLGQKLSKLFEKKVKDLKLEKSVNQARGKRSKSPLQEEVTSRRSARR